MLKPVKFKQVILASTGIVARRFHGSTLHSWAGFRLAVESAEDLWKKFGSRKNLRKKWTDVKVIIIDEGDSYY